MPLRFPAPIPVAVLLLLLPVVPAAAEPPVYPAGWQGVWMVTTEARDCDTGEIVSVEVAADTICAGDPFGFDVEGVHVECTGLVTDDAVAAECSGTAAPFPGCEAVLSSQVEGSRTGDAFSMTQRVLVDLPSTCPFRDLCFDVRMTAERTSDASGICPPVSGVEPLSWGVIKVRYRPAPRPR